MLDAACTDGTVGSLTTAAGLTGTATGSAIVVRRPATCTVSETSNGQTKEASLFATTVAVDSGSAVTATKASVHVASGSHHTVAFTDEYKGLSPTGAAGTAVYALLSGWAGTSVRNVPAGPPRADLVAAATTRRPPPSGDGRLVIEAQIACTFSACGPFWP